MKNSKPLVREAYKVAAKDMLPVLKEKRKEKERLFDESWVVGVSELDCVETRRLNAELGLNTLAGINQWYNI
jgi:hypothetical protein